MGAGWIQQTHTMLTARGHRAGAAVDSAIGTRRNDGARRPPGAANAAALAALAATRKRPRIIIIDRSRSSFVDGDGKRWYR